MSDSVLTGLCREAEWIWRRVGAVRRTQPNCNSEKLFFRLESEIQSLWKRCIEIRMIGFDLENKGFADSIQLSLLNELVNRSLLHRHLTHAS